MSMSKSAANRKVDVSPPVVRAPWKETDFEKWFLAHPEFPGEQNKKEKVLVIAQHRPIKRMVDIVALDRDGGLVIIEVKNERSTRSAVGQALEYLSQYQGVTLEELEDEFAELGQGTLSQAFTARFKRELTKVSPRRRVFVAAPGFDYHSDVCVQFLSKALGAEHAEFGLLVVSTTGDSQIFALAAHEPIKLTPAKDLKGFVMSPRGRIYYVLEPGARPVMWLIGKRDEEGSLVLPKATALKQLIRIRAKPHVIMEQGPAEIQIPAAESTWRKNKEGSEQARLIGVIHQGSRQRAALARFKDGRFVKYQLKNYAGLRGKWTKGPVKGLPEWREVASVSAKANASSAGPEAP